MKILQYIDSLAIGGAERMAVNISNVLTQDGHEVVLCISRNTGELSAFVSSSVKVVCLKKKKSYDLIAFIRLLKLIKKHQIELIHAHSSSVVWAAAAKIFFPKTKLIWHDHYGNGEHIKATDRKEIQRLSSQIDGIIAVNENLKRWSEKYTKVKNENVRYIGNFPLLRLPKNERVFKKASIQIVCLANLRAQKDHFTLVKSIKLLTEKSIPTSIKVILAGNYVQDSYYSQLMELIKKNELEHIIQIAGAIKDTSALLWDSDIGVLSSVSEGLPVSLLEYGLAGLPVVVTQVGQCAEVVDNGRAGRVVAPEHPKDLTNALYELIQDIDLRMELGSKLKKRVEEEYGAKKFLKAYYQLIHDMRTLEPLNHIET